MQQYAVEYQYDNRGGRLRMMITSGSNTTTWNYSASGWLTGKRDHADKGADSTWTNGGKLQSRDWQRVIPSTSTRVKTMWNYHAHTGELASVDQNDSTPDVVHSYDRLGRSSQITQTGHSLVYAYDASTEHYDSTSKTKAMKLPYIVSIICVLLCNGIAYSQPALPTWDQLQDLIGKEEEAPEIRPLLEAETIFLYHKKQITDRLPNGRLKFVTVTQYGGAGFIIVVEEDKLIGFPTRDATKVMRPAKVASVLLILGNCEEAEQLGKWKGALPEGLHSPSGPADLLRRHNEADTDRETIVNSGGIELSRRRSIYFGGPIPENSKFPYGFIFDANQFSILVLLPLRKSIIIPPIKPKK